MTHYVSIMNNHCQSTRKALSSVRLLSWIGGVMMISFFVLPHPALAQTEYCEQISTGASDEVTSIICRPQPRIQIPGLSFDRSEDLQRLIEEEGGVSYLRIPFIGEYMAAIYRWSVVVITVIASIMIIVAGIQWLSSAGNQNAIQQAQKRILNAVIGIVLAVGSYTVLSLINSDLVEFDALRVEMVRSVPVEFDDINPLPGYALPEGSGNLPAGFQIPPGAAPVDLPRRENPIPYLIGNLPSAYGTCTSEGARYTANQLHNLGICVGPCHCAYTASHFLNYIGCTIEYDGGASSLARNAEEAGWVEVNIEDVTESTPAGLLVANGHVGVYLGNNMQFDSGYGYGDYDNFNYTCPSSRWFYDIDPFDPQENCSACSLIPSQAPATGRFGANHFNQPGQPGENAQVIGTNNGTTCAGIQIWTQRELQDDPWNRLLHPPTAAPL